MAEETKIAIKLEEEAKPIKKMCEKLMDSINYELDKGIENVDTKELGEAIDMVKDLYEAKKEMYEACYYKQIMEAMEESEYGEDYDEYGPMEDGRRGYRGQPRSQSGRFMSRGDGRRSNRGRGGRRGYEEPMYFEMTPEMYHMYPPEYWRDMDREQMGRMYYDGGSSSGGSTGSSSRGGSSMGGQGGSTSGMSGGQSSGGSNGGSRGYSEQGEGGQYSSRMQREERDSREGRSGQSRRSYMETKEMNKGNSQQEKQEKMKELENYMKELSTDVTEMISDASPEEKSMLKQKLQVLMQKV